MKIGFLLCAYNQEEFIHDCLKDLVKFSKDNGHLISAVSVPFAEYKDFEVEVDNTTEILRGKLGNEIDFLIDGPQYISEAEARTLTLKPLLDKDIDYFFMLDSDEFFTYEQLNNIVNFIGKDEFITWYSLSYKNYVGEGYLEEPFTPPRVFKVNVKGGSLSHFYYDNDVVYNIGGEEVNYKELSNKNVPKEVAWISHKSWINTEKNKLKCAYQEKRWNPPYGNGCAYKWDDEKGIVFNEEYFTKTNQRIPKIIND